MLFNFTIYVCCILWRKVDLVVIKRTFVIGDGLNLMNLELQLIFLLNFVLVRNVFFLCPLFLCLFIFIWVLLALGYEFTSRYEDQRQYYEYRCNVNVQNVYQILIPIFAGEVKPLFLKPFCPVIGEESADRDVEEGPRKYPKQQSNQKH